MSETHSIKAFEASLTDMHALASGSFSRIRGMARCALRSLETEGGARDLESIAEVLQAIAMDADASFNLIDVEAERCGLETVSEAWHRRLQAMPKNASQAGGTV